MGYENKIPNKTVSTVYLNHHEMDKSIPPISFYFRNQWLKPLFVNQNT